ncbi:MAG: sensor histidine kinase [Rubricoccaceae bacterium]
MPLTLIPSPAAADALAPGEMGAVPGELAAFATVVAHRLRSLVGGIQGYAELLADLLTREDERALALGILEGAAAIERVCAGLVYYSHLPAPVPVRVAPAALAADLLRALGPAADPVVLADLLPDGFTADTDPALLRQILLVLLQNALEAAPPGSPVTLVLAVAGTALTAEVRNEAAVPPDERAFTLFHTTKSSHLGLGLPLARRLAESMGGTLTLAPALAPPPREPGSAGASVVTFRLSLPCAAPAA